jgi:redox-sensitive bicupin YhaK (pirin superfamily)
VNHRDSLGNAGLIGPGDVQWMTAGGGILHEEMPRRGPDGSIFGFQLWVNLPAAQKLSRPRYQEVSAATIPILERGPARLRLVAGELDGAPGPVTEIAARPIYMDVSLAPQAEFVQSIPDGHTALAYVFEGAGIFAGERVAPVKMVSFGEAGSLQVQTEADPVRFMLIAGLPFREPIVPYGPFVMNTREEIQQALQDLRAGTFVWQEPVDSAR